MTYLNDMSSKPVQLHVSQTWGHWESEEMPVAAGELLVILTSFAHFQSHLKN